MLPVTPAFCFFAAQCDCTSALPSLRDALWQQCSKRTKGSWTIRIVNVSNNGEMKRRGGKASGQDSGLMGLEAAVHSLELCGGGKSNL